jgi:hypothetical protein
MFTEADVENGHHPLSPLDRVIAFARVRSVKVITVIYSWQSMWFWKWLGSLFTLFC